MGKTKTLKKEERTLLMLVTCISLELRKKNTDRKFKVKSSPTRSSIENIYKKNTNESLTSANSKIVNY